MTAIDPGVGTRCTQAPTGAHRWPGWPPSVRRAHTGAGSDRQPVPCRTAHDGAAAVHARQRSLCQELILIVRTTIACAHKLPMNAVAEAVENQDPLQCLQKAGCELMQGEYFSPLLPFVDLMV